MSALDGVRAVSLDAHGTLIELVPPAPLLRAVLSRRFGVSVAEDEVQTAFIAEVRHYRAHMLEGRDPESLAGLRLRCAEVLRAALPPSPALAAVAGADLAGALVESLVFRPFPEVSATLRTLHAAGLYLAVTSNWDSALGEHLTALGLTRELALVVTSAAAGVGKPDPLIFRSLLARSGAAPAEIVHVGDQFDEDVVAARAAGIEPVLLVRDGGPAPAGVRVIHSLAELPALLGLEAPTV